MRTTCARNCESSGTTCAPHEGHNTQLTQMRQERRKIFVYDTRLPVYSSRPRPIIRSMRYLDTEVGGESEDSLNREINCIDTRPLRSHFYHSIESFDTVVSAFA